MDAGGVALTAADCSGFGCSGAGTSQFSTIGQPTSAITTGTHNTAAIANFSAYERMRASSLTTLAARVPRYLGPREPWPQNHRTQGVNARGGQ
jgi:hypothetical protein